VMLSLTLLFPPVSALFRFGTLHLGDLALTLGAGVLVLVFLEALKSIWRGRLSHSSQGMDTRFGSRPI
jgi:Ca2+-transporting ATPase